MIHINGDLLVQIRMNYLALYCLPSTVYIYLFYRAVFTIELLIYSYRDYKWNMFV